MIVILLPVLSSSLLSDEMLLVETETSKRNEIDFDTNTSQKIIHPSIAKNMDLVD